MSKSRTDQITCPRCHYDSPMTIWTAINADLDTDLKEKFLTGELFKWKCEVCGLETMVQFATVYHDLEHSFMLILDPIEDNRDINETYGFDRVPSLHLPDYTCRVVYGMNSLREKIDILEAGLNDIAVERMKYFLLMDKENHIRDTDVFLCIGVDASEEAIQATGWQRGAILFVRFRVNANPKLMPFPLELYFDYLLASNMDPRMEVPKSLCVDSIWMNHQLKNS